ncbi:GntR family transcriptional regulator, LSA1692 subfamily [Vagococcus intermedius]|uniref:GntR family transcriptional regulator n=1 Tax=Vagococcus intermedius TaxID=2991418 RepID=A0AAF0I924_9ENTE|nr:GntR family transcriptional regulator, LSA1692 subfamily [Vagococcus intermedius]WEG73067.1 GntR family transcriptional regulator [Vagococcus intermedius]WEG75151.1 GntR family transcriptional regulator [Vagococcus intermedius]
MTTKKIPIYKQIAEELLAEIKSDALMAGDRLPTEYELAETFNVSRLTIRKSIDYLIAHNILIKQKNQGTYVVGHGKIKSGDAGLAGFSEIIRQLGMTPSTKLIEMTEIYLPPEEIKTQLALIEKETVIYIKRVRYANNEPLVIENLHIPKKFLGDISSINFEVDSIFETIEKHSLIGYSQQEISAELMSEDISKLLDVAPQSPVLLVNTTTYSVKGDPILLDNSYYRSDKYVFKNTLHRQQV